MKNKHVKSLPIPGMPIPAKVVVYDMREMSLIIYNTQLLELINYLWFVFCVYRFGEVRNYADTIHKLNYTKYKD